MGHAKERKRERRQSEKMRLKSGAKGWMGINTQQRPADWSLTMPDGPSVIVYQTTLRTGGGQGK